MRSWIRGLLVGAGALVLVCGGLVAAVAAGRHQDAEPALSHDLRTIDRSASWTLLSKLKLGFPTYHPEGLVVTKHRFYLSSTQIITPTVPYPAPVNGYDRSPGRGIGHLFVISRSGKLLRDVVLGHGIVYHPGGIDLHGHDLWVPVAQYRPNSTAEIDRVDTRTLRVHRQFGVSDHIGGVVYDSSTGHLVGNNWGSRRFYEWTRSGRQVSTWRNPDDVLDFQDCQYVSRGRMACGGITGLPQTPTAGGSAAVYELGGFALLDLRRHTVLNEVPFQHFSDAGHVMTRNPLKFQASGRKLTMYAAPDNGEDVAGTEIYTWTTTLAG